MVVEKREKKQQNNFCRNDIQRPAQCICPINLAKKKKTAAKNHTLVAEDKSGGKLQKEFVCTSRFKKQQNIMLQAK